MKLTAAELFSLSKQAVDAALGAGALIERAVGTDLRVETKSSAVTAAGQAVTEVDHQCQELILNLLSPTIEKYDLGLLAEETEDDLSRLKKDYFWCVDPLDGTLNFVNDRPGYAVSIALVSRAGESVVGVVYDPVERTLYHATKGQGLYRNGTVLMSPGKAEGTTTEFEAGGAVMNACWAIERAPAVFCKRPKAMQGGGCVWDYAATTRLFIEMGGWVSDCFGQPLNLNPPGSVYFNRTGVLFATSPDLAAPFILSKP